MTDYVLVRNRETGKEKMVPPKTAEMMKNEACFMEKWEVPKPGSPPPHEVITFQEKKQEGADPQPMEFSKVEPEKVPANTAKEVDLAALSVRKLADRLEYLNFEQLTGLRDDPRKSVKAMVEKELKKRDDEKSNSSSKQKD